ncbi:MAG TPA: GNAT family N-acetyltransferase [Gaiellaceae bacterium]|nr:GNAT family N-acetyltransferase [Gaiellaceae bacterium]
MALTLREAHSDEAETLARLQEESAVAGFSNVFPPGRYPFPRQVVLESWRELLVRDDVVALVAEDEGELLGLAVARLDWLERLYTHPSAWGRGVGSRLHDDALELVRGFGSSSCSLWVLEANDRARSFYERRGWRLNGRTRVVPFPPHPLDLGYTLDF